MNHSFNSEAKRRVYEYWNEQPCNLLLSDKEKFSKELFDELETQRYQIVPEILNFADFEKYKNKKVLEIGVGLGIDFKRWILAGAKSYGIDLTNEAINYTKKCLQIYGLSAEELKVADAESLPYADNFFDVVYSWSTIQHTPDFKLALGEIVRVTCPGGICKIMIYNRHSLNSVFQWFQHGLLKGKPFRKLADVIEISEHNIGTKTFTRSEIECLLQSFPVENIRIKTFLCHRDLLKHRNKILQCLTKILGLLLGNKAGFFMTIEFNKIGNLAHV